MSTRCQVEVKAVGLAWEDTVVLYHHCDGYPSYMLPLILKAYRASIAPKAHGRGDTAVKINYAWQAGRPGKAAAQLCAADRYGFDVESSLDLHSDIEWFYSIECVNKNGGSIGEIPSWCVTIYKPGPKFNWDKPSRVDLIQVTNGNILKLGRLVTAKRIEKNNS